LAIIRKHCIYITTYTKRTLPITVVCKYISETENQSDKYHIKQLTNQVELNTNGTKLQHDITDLQVHHEAHVPLSAFPD